MFDDEDEDLTKLDRGDEVVEGEGKDDDKVEPEKVERPRNKGKFVKKVEVKEVEVDEVEADEVKVKDPNEGEDEDEEEEEEEDDTSAGKGKDNLTIRLNKARQQRDAERQAREKLEQRLAALEKTRDEPKVDPVKTVNAELDALYEEVEELRADGKSKEAAKVQREIDSKNRWLATHEASKIASVASTKAQLDARYDDMVDVITGHFDVLNPDSEDYDREQVRDLEFQVAAYEKMGMSAPAALQKAVKLLFREDPFAPTKKAKVEPEVKKTEKEEPAKKKETDIKKAIDTVKKQPADMSGRGVNKDETELDPTKLTEDEMAALPESKRKQMRGDFL